MPFLLSFFFGDLWRAHLLKSFFHCTNTTIWLRSDTRRVLLLFIQRLWKKRDVWSDKLHLDVKNFKVLQMLWQSTPSTCMATFRNRLAVEERISYSSEYSWSRKEPTGVMALLYCSVLFITWNHLYIHSCILHSHFSYTQGRGEGFEGVLEPVAAVSGWRQGYTPKKVPVYLRVCM